jgi:hypothetical protein
MSSIKESTRILEVMHVPVKLKLAASWAALMFLYAYGDIFSYFRPGVYRGCHGGGSICLRDQSSVLVGDFDIRGNSSSDGPSVLGIARVGLPVELSERTPPRRRVAHPPARASSTSHRVGAQLARATSRSADDGESDPEPLEAAAAWSPRLRLMLLSFERVEFGLLDVDGQSSRPVIVRVGSGQSWRRAVQFPTIGSDATESAGDHALDALIRERAAEELVRLQARRRRCWAA